MCCYRSIQRKEQITWNVNMTKILGRKIQAFPRVPDLRHQGIAVLNNLYGKKISKLVGIALRITKD